MGTCDNQFKDFARLVAYNAKVYTNQLVNFKNYPLNGISADCFNEEMVAEFFIYTNGFAKKISAVYIPETPNQITYYVQPRSTLPFKELHRLFNFIN